jgi:NADH-quinone oxidoreductase subunit C
MTDTAETETTADEVVDEARTALLDALIEELGDSLVEHHLVPGVDLWIRVKPEAFGDTAAYLRDRQRFRFFDFLSAIDWLPSPFGRSLDAAVDTVLEGDGENGENEAMTTGYAGGDARFQVFARVANLTTGIGVTVKADLDSDTMAVATWTDHYPGADWHEREAWEMFGIEFIGHPGLRPLYLPGDFEGHPMRKDFPLLARLVKPWPGIVDVEPMPTTENPEDVAS